MEISLSSRASANDSEILHALVFKGVGIAKIPRWMAAPYLQDGTLQDGAPVTTSFTADVLSVIW